MRFVLTGRKVPAPTWSVSFATLTPAAWMLDSSSLVKCKPAVGAATAPTLAANTVWYVLWSTEYPSFGRLIYGGKGIIPKRSIAFIMLDCSNFRLISPASNFSSTKALNSGAKLIRSPTLRRLAGRAKARHRNSSMRICKVTSTLAFPRLPNSRAGSTFVSLSTNISPERNMLGRSLIVLSIKLLPTKSNRLASLGVTGC